MPALHVFIDTNVFLSFYAYNSDDIEQLKKLSDLIKGGTLKLYVPQQVTEEFSRNREVKLAASIADFSQVGPKALPRFLADYEEAAAYHSALAGLSKARNALVQKATDDAATVSFAVDKLVIGLFQDAVPGLITDGMITKARLRRDVGNPPGKGSSLGDQINWEYLLATVPENTNLHIVSKDGDFQSAFKNGKPHQYLCEEWRKKKSGELILHKEIKPFLNNQFENIKLEVDKEKSAAINLLVNSGAFSVTHLAISQIDPLLDALTTEDAAQLIGAGLTNSQIKWIGTDADVSAFYNKLIASYGDQLDTSVIAAANEVFNKSEAVETMATDDPDLDVPF